MGVGEKFDALEPFHPERMASRILGMGDMLTLIERAEAAFDQEKAEKLEKKLKKNQFTLEDFLSQMRKIRKMGPLKDLLGMMPGMNQLNMDALNNVDAEKEMAHVEAIILSMTKAERNNPPILNGPRKKRIALGSGRSIAEVNRLLKQFEDTRKVMKNVVGGGLRGAMKMAKAKKRR